MHKIHVFKNYDSMHKWMYSIQIKSQASGYYKTVAKDGEQWDSDKSRRIRKEEVDKSLNNGRSEPNSTKSYCASPQPNHHKDSMTYGWS